MAYLDEKTGISRTTKDDGPDEFHFNSDEFLNLSGDEKVWFCAKSAEHAHNLATRAAEPHQGYYLEIAKQWLLLAKSIMDSRSP